MKTVLIIAAILLSTLNLNAQGYFYKKIDTTATTNSTNVNQELDYSKFFVKYWNTPEGDGGGFVNGILNATKDSIYYTVKGEYRVIPTNAVDTNIVLTCAWIASLKYATSRIDSDPNTLKTWLEYVVYCVNGNQDLPEYREYLESQILETKGLGWRRKLKRYSAKENGKLCYIQLNAWKYPGYYKNNY